jgi:hypothetical protein
MAFLEDFAMSERDISCVFIGFFEAVRHGKRVFRAVLMDDVGFLEKGLKCVISDDDQ